MHQGLQIYLSDCDFICTRVVSLTFFLYGPGSSNVFIKLRFYMHQGRFSYFFYMDQGLQMYLSNCDFICTIGGWLGGAKVSCIFCHRGVQLILAYSWARPAILVAGKGREVMFLFLLFLHFHSCSSFFPVPLFHLFCYLFCLFSPFLWETTQNDPQGLTCR